MAVKSDEYRRALAAFPSGVTVISARRENGVADAVTVSAFAALSLSPPLVLACIGADSDCYALLRGCERFGVNILHSRQGGLALAFAELGSGKREALAQFDPLWDERGASAPLLRDCAVRLACRREEVIVQGDHIVLVGAVEATEIVSDGAPLVYAQGGFRELAGC